jgi:hypothetical protein
LLPDPERLRAAKAPLLRKLVHATFTESSGWSTESLPGGVSKCVGRRGDTEVIVRIDFGSTLSQLGYTVTLKNVRDESLIFAQLSYERLWDAAGRWDYVSEDNAPRCVAFLAEQVAHLADLGGRLSGRATHRT